MRAMRAMRTLLLICAACAVDGLKPAARKVMLIRHAESEHNEAERNWDLRGLLLKRDHGITERGYKQCDALQAYVAEQRADAASPWADARLELYASPLTRAIQTALIATDGIDKPLVLLPDARELGAGPIAGRDSLGAAVGVLEILDRVSDESRHGPWQSSASMRRGASGDGGLAGSRTSARGAAWTGSSGSWPTAATGRRPWSATRSSSDRSCGGTAPTTGTSRAG